MYVTIITMIEIIQNATVVYTDGVQEQFDAVRITPKGIVIGRLFNTEGDEEFFMCGFIPLRNVHKVVGGTKRTIQQIQGAP